MGRKGFGIFLIRWRWFFEEVRNIVIRCNWLGDNCLRFLATNWYLLSAFIVD